MADYVLQCDRREELERNLKGRDSERETDVPANAITLPAIATFVKHVHLCHDHT
jgi:hypothetical protein